MDIEVERGVEIQIGRPRDVLIRLIGNDKEVKGTISVYPDFVPSHEFSTNDTFKVVINKGGLFGSLDMKFML